MADCTQENYRAASGWFDLTARVARVRRAIEWRRGTWRSAQDLKRLGDHELNDIGLTRADAERILRDPFADPGTRRG